MSSEHSAEEPGGRGPTGGGDRGVALDDLYRLLVESVPDYAIFVLDPDGRVASWNAGAKRIKGWAAEEIIGRHYGIFYPESHQGPDPDTQLEVAAREGRYETEGWRLRKDGSRFWAHVVITALYDRGELLGFGKVTGDRTAEREARQELARRERQLEEAQQIAHLGSWEYDTESGRVYCSDELFRILDIPPRQAIAFDELVTRVHPEDRTELERSVQHAIDTGEPYVQEHRIIRPDDEVRWVQNRGEVLSQDTAGTRLVGTTLDITDIKAGEEQERRLASEQAARQEAERTAQRMGFLAEASALLNASLDLPETLRTVAWLAIPSFADWCAVDMTGPGGDLQRLAVAHLDPEQVKLAEELHERYPPDPAADSGVVQVLRSGEPELYEEVPRELLLETARDDHHRQLLTDLGLDSALLVPIGVRDRTVGVITFVYAESDRRYSRDDLVVAQELANRAGLAIENAQLHAAERDARQHAERARERTTRLQAITAELSETVTPKAVARVMVDQGVAALGASNGALVLTRADGSLEMVRSVGLPEDVHEQFRHFDPDAGMPLAEAIRTGELVTVRDGAELARRYPPGRDMPRIEGLEAMVSVPLRSGEGVIGSLGFGYREQRSFTGADRSFMEALGRQCAQALERAWLYETEHEAREAAEAASLAKSQFVAMMSHELRTPLSAILGYQELLAEQISGPVNDKQRKQLGRIRAAAVHLRDLINQILSLSQIEAGSEEVHREPVELVALVEDAVVMMQHEADRKGIALEAELPDELRIETDAGKVRQILLNLMSNAVKFTEHGSVTTGLETDGDDVLIWVRDTGVGIDEADRERIFEVFTQADQSMTRSVGGSGLGLAVSRKVAGLLGGNLELESDPGRGSTFTLRLPRS